MTDWKSDPKLKKLRTEFIESLEDRKKVLTNALEAYQVGHDESALDRIQEASHKIAGIAGTWGFQELGEISELLDDYFDHFKATKTVPIKRDVVDFVDLLVEVVGLAMKDKKVSALQTDNRYRRITSFVGSLPSAAKP